MHFSELLAITRISSLILFLYIPLVSLYAPVNGTTGLKYVNVFWDSVLHISIWPIVILSFGVGYVVAAAISPPTSSSTSLLSPPLLLVSPSKNSQTNGTETASILCDEDDGENNAYAGEYNAPLNSSNCWHNNNNNDVLPTHNPFIVQAATRQGLICLVGKMKRRFVCPPALKRGSSLCLVEFAVVTVVLTITIAQSIQSQLQVVHPSWIWNPFLWVMSYRVYHPEHISVAMEGICLEKKASTKKKVERLQQQGKWGKPGMESLCLSPSDFEELSSGMISGLDAIDVQTILRGIQYTKYQSGGLIVAILSRNTMEWILPLRQNVEGLLPFFNKLSVVVFENDSHDGSRDAFLRWSDDIRKTEEGGGGFAKYEVDVMECEEAPGCKFGIVHRYEGIDEEVGDYFTTSAVGPMAKFRQRMVDYITSSTKYSSYSHMLVLDIDLGVSVSPMGILHSLGLHQDKVVASASRQVWPGSFGTLIPPYDFAPFRAMDTPSNRRLIELTQKFCELSPPGDRWRNQCESVSPLHLILILSLDRSGYESYSVASAFNGAALYPLDLVRKTGARYDSGEDGQRCEHVGFHLSLGGADGEVVDVIQVNPKWRMHLSPSRPGGPDGAIAMKNVARIVATPQISVTIFFGTMFSMIVVVYASMTLAVAIHFVLRHGMMRVRWCKDDFEREGKEN